jgi:SAM-dependent methyltransferase
MEETKELVKDYWNAASCGEDLYLKGDDERSQFVNQMNTRYALEPYILPFAAFEQSKGKTVLEIGVGLGADHQRFAEAGARLYGIDLTERAVAHTRHRLQLFNLSAELQTADAENLPFQNNQFDWVYSWGVIHHSPNTATAIAEIFRVLKPGGLAKIMIYNKHSMIGYMLWLRYALMTGKPFTGLKKIYSTYLESPGTKAYTPTEARFLFQAFDGVSIDTVLTHGDLLTSQAGQRHKGALLSLARKLYPRFIIRKIFPKSGLFMLVSAQKPK